MNRPATSNLVSRLATAGVAGPLLLWLLFAGPAYGWFLLVLAASALSSYELFSMTHPEDRVARWFLAGLSTLVSACLYLYTQDPKVLLTLIMCLPIASLVFSLGRVGTLETAALRFLSATAGPWYIGGLLSCLALLRRDAGETGPFFVLLALKLSWLADTGGYFAGRYLGRYFPAKLHPRVSPKKTWVGFGGSLLGAVASAVIAKLWYLPHPGWLELIALGAVAGSLGQLGDLVESALKRSTGIKDSGSLIPGHGGLLDRIDALLIVSPLLYVYSLWRF